MKYYSNKYLDYLICTATKQIEQPLGLKSCRVKYWVWLSPGNICENEPMYSVQISKGVSATVDCIWQDNSKKRLSHEKCTSLSRQDVVKHTEQSSRWQKH